MREAAYHDEEYLTRLPISDHLFWKLKHKVPEYPLVLINAMTGETKEVEVQYISLKEDTLLS